MRKNNYLLFGFILAAIILLDQISKMIVVANMPLNYEIDLIPGFFSLHYVQNTGAGFSILEGKMNLFYILTIIAVVLLSYFFFTAKNDENLLRLSLVMLIGGALGNFIDRLLNRYVIDFLDFVIFGYDFPVFNLADTFLTIGVGLFILAYFFEVKELKWKR